MKIAVIDYNMSNMYSVRNALDLLGCDCHIVSDPAALGEADGAILPGVGSFPEAMKHLADLDMVEPIRDFIAADKPFIGICLGLQLLFRESEEFGRTAGLGVLDGVVEGFHRHQRVQRVPHVGWNRIVRRSAGMAGKINLDDSAYFYFVHSYYVNPADSDVVFTTTEYDGFEFCSSVAKDKVFACQFHPEKSGGKGLEVLKGFIELCREETNVE